MMKAVFEMKRHSMLSLQILLSICFASFASVGHTASAAAGDLVVENAWSRATVGMGGTGVIYMTIKNKGALGDRLVGVSSSVARVAEVHETRSSADATVTMAPVAAVPVPAHGQADESTGLSSGWTGLGHGHAL